MAVNQIIKPTENAFLVDYMAAIRKGFGHVDFLSTGADDRELSSPSSNRIYVVPHFSESHLDPQTEPETWGDLLALDTLLTDPEYRKLFIKGDPGIGKTTLLRRIAYVLSTPENAAFRERLGHPVPLVVTLREEVFRQVATWDEFIQAIFLQPTLKLIKPDWETISRILKSGQAFFLLDGLDEVTDQEQRKRLSSILQYGLEQFSEVRWWCTTRVIGFSQVQFWWGKLEDGLQIPLIMNISAYDLFIDLKKKIKFQESHTVEFSDEALKKLSLLGDNENLKDLTGSISLNTILHNKESNKISHLLNFKEVFLAPFDTAQIRHLMTLWFDLFEEVEHLRPERLARFMEAIEGHENIRHLARIPNLLTMMAIYHNVNRDFPDGRYELYDKIIEAYLKIILRQRNLTMHDLQYDEIRHCLAHLAYEMQKLRQGSTQADSLLTINRAQAEEVFVNALKDVLRRDTEQQRREKTKGFFDSLEIRSDILMPRGEGAYGFLHLSIQEFLSAEDLHRTLFEVTGMRGSKEKEKEFWEELKKVADNDAWVETLVLFFEGFKAIPGYKADDCLYAFEKLMDWDKSSGAVDFDVLAAKILTDEFISQLFTEAERGTVLNGLITKKLSIHFDDNYLQFLLDWATRKGMYFYWQKNEDIPFASASIKWIKVAPSIHAFDRLAKFSALEILDLEECVFSDVSPLANLTNLVCLDLSSTQVKDVSPLANLTNLSSLELSRTQVTDVSPLANLTNLSSLELRSTQVTDVSPLANLTNLVWLDLRSTQVTDVSPLANLTNLSLLELSSTQVSDVSPLANLINLSSLELSSTQVKDMSPLANLTNLSSLYLSSTQVKDVSPLANLTNLSSLNLTGTQVSDVSPLANLTNLTSLNLTGTQVSDVSPLATLTNLGSLNLTGTQVSDVSPLANLTNLRLLYLTSLQVKDVSPLANLTNLRFLYLRSTQVSDLRPLANLTNLSSLTLTGMQVSDVSPLANLTNLSSLNLTGTQVKDVRPLANLTNLRVLNLTGTQVKDVSPLANLTNLTSLVLKNMQVSDAKINQLKKALPALTIHED